MEKADNETCEAFYLHFFWHQHKPGAFPGDLQPPSCSWSSWPCLFSEVTLCRAQSSAIVWLGFHEQLCWSSKIFCYKHVCLYLWCTWNPRFGQKKWLSVKAQYVASANLPNGFFFVWKGHLLKQLIQSSFDLKFSKDTWLPFQIWTIGVLLSMYTIQWIINSLTAKHVNLPEVSHWHLLSFSFFLNFYMSPELLCY